MITYSVEQWPDVIEEAVPLLVRHWEEIATDKDKIPLDIDYASYEALHEAGALHIVVAREDGRMIGYYCSVVRPHLHYKSTMFAFTDIFFVAPEYRNGRIGLGLFKRNEQSLKALGVQKIFGASKITPDAGPLFRRLGYGTHETVYSKWIG